MTDVTTGVTADNRFSIIPHWVIRSGVSGTAIHLYTILMMYANNETGQAWPTRTTLARELDKGTKTVDRALKELEDAGAVTIRRRQRAGTKECYSSLYTVITAAPHHGKRASSGEDVDSGSRDGVASNMTLGGVMDDPENYTHLTRPTSVTPPIPLESEHEVVAPRVSTSETPTTTTIDTSKAEKADPIGALWYHSTERQQAIMAVSRLAYEKACGTDESIENAMSDLGAVIDEAFNLDAESASEHLIWDRGWTPPRKATGKLEAAIWLNKFLYAVMEWDGQLTFTPRLHAT